MKHEPDLNAAIERIDWGSLVRFARESAGLTQHLLSRKMCCHQSSVSRFEDGPHPPTLRTLARIAVETSTQLEVTFKALGPKKTVAFDGDAFAEQRRDLTKASLLERHAKRLRERYPV